MEKDSSKNVRAKIEILEIESHFLLTRGVCFQKESLRNAAVSENLACKHLALFSRDAEKGASFKLTDWGLALEVTWLLQNNS